MEIQALTKALARRPFDSGDGALDEFFRRYAVQNQFRHHIGVTHVAVEGQNVLGYVTLCAASVEADDLPSGRRVARYPLPVLRLARLAVARTARGLGVGGALLAHAGRLALEMRDSFGCVGVWVDAKPGAVPFYAHHAFEQVRAGERGTAMFLPLAVIESALG